MSRSDKVIRLNVGGMFYTTMKSTLSFYHGSVLWRIATGNQACHRDERGNYVIDRDGPVFRHVLNYLRTSKLLLPQGFRDLDLLKEDALYYGIDSMAQEIDSLLENRRKRRKGQNRMKRISASVGDNMNQIHEDEDELDFFEDSWIGSNHF